MSAGDGAETALSAVALLTCLVATCAACGGERVETPAPGSSSCAEATAANDAPPVRIELRYARNFVVEEHEDGRLVRVRNPWRGAGTELRYFLVRCGNVPRTVPEGARLVEVPAERVVTTSTTQISHLVALDVTDRLVGHHELFRVASPDVRRRIEAGLVREVGGGSQIDLETLVELRPDVVLAFSSGSPDYDLPSRLGGTGIPAVVFAAYMEETPLARAEWIKLTSLFVGKEAEATRIFDDVAERYGALARVGAQAEERPTVLVGAPFRGVWHVSGGRSYIARLLADAGARYLWADDDSRGGVPLDMESVYARARDADVWLHPWGFATLEEALHEDPRFAAFRALREGRVYANDARALPGGGNDYFETGSLRPDLVLEDLLTILHPNLRRGHELVFYRRLESPAASDGDEGARVR